MKHSFHPPLFIWTLCAVLLLPLLSGCRHDGEQKPKLKPSRLAGNLFSGDTLPEVEKKLEGIGASFDILNDRQPLAGDSRPPYHLLVISKKDVRLNGAAGELVLSFLNNRLMTAQLYVANLAQARASVEAAQQISLASGSSFIEPSTHIWVGRDRQGRNYIGWIDKTLQAEQDAWIRQYSDQ